MIVLTVEAALAVVVLAAHHRVDRLRVVPLRNARGVVDVVPVPWIEHHAEDLDAARDGDLVLRRVYHLVNHAVAYTLIQVVVLRRLIKDVGDDAVPFRTEPLVRRNVGEAAGPEHADVGRHIGCWACWAGHSVERPGVQRVESAHGAVGSDARVAGRSEDVAGALLGRCGEKERGEEGEGGRAEHRRVCVTPQRS